jgi:DNA-directed RNA polymerase subunit beta
MGDEDDDLLRAAEELGIDLSGVRSTDGGQANDEKEELEITEGEEGQTDDDAATDAGYIEPEKTD